MTVQGIDVSEYQGTVDFNKVKAAGYSFVIIRAGYGNANAYPDQRDPYFERNYKGAKAAGLGVGVYWYSYAKSADGAKKEAESCIAVIKGKKFEYPIFFDIEERSQLDKGKAFCDSLINSFCTTLEKAGYFAGIYCSTYWLTNCVSEEVRKRFTVWIAEWGRKCTYTGSYGIWQNGTARVDGVKGEADHDFCYIDYPSRIKEAGLNGYGKPAEEPLLDKSGCFAEGERGAGVLAFKELLKLAKKKKLITADITDSCIYDSGTVSAVKELQKRWGFRQTGLAGENLVSRLYGEL